MFSGHNYWFWTPPLACMTGMLTFVTVYQLMIGNHLPDVDNEEEELDQQKFEEQFEERGKCNNGYTKDNHHLEKVNTKM